ncbi:MAG: hypothetical protein PHY31_05720, partial [Smithellaceae bacterium]|nr:hypothetical protein [Smithellaceae bacterium]
TLQHLSGMKGMPPRRQPSPIYFSSVPIEPPRERIYRRLGYRLGVTEMGRQLHGEVERYIDEARELIALQGAVLRLPILERTSSSLTLSGGSFFASRKLVSFLRDAEEVLLMGATAGSAITDRIYDDAAGEGITRGVVFDATASECVDAALDWLMGYFAQLLRREGRAIMNKRFSAGYGDFSLENQRTFYMLLDLKRISVELTSSLLLIPEKSVTAVTGIGKTNT